MSSKEYCFKLLEVAEEWEQQNDPDYHTSLLPQAKAIINRCVQHDTVYPAITFAGPAELNFYWKAGKVSLEISLENGEFYVSRV
jgi:hypothetical protein